MAFGKKLITFVIALLMLSVIQMKTVNAQGTAATEPEKDTPYETAYKEYQKQIEEYNSAHSEYELRRSQYMRFKTLQSQQDAFTATSKMLQERDDVVIYYLKAVKERLNEAIGVKDSPKTALNFKIDQEVGWFSDHRDRVHSAGTLDDLVNDNKSAKDRYLYSDVIFYDSLSNISSGKIYDFDERINDQFKQLKDKYNTIKNETRDEYKLSDSQIIQLDRWVLDADNRILRSQEKHAEAEKIIATFPQSRSKGYGVYSSVMQKLTESQTFLKESGNYLMEIIRIIKST